jgi:cytochrome c
MNSVDVESNLSHNSLLPLFARTGADDKIAATYRAKCSTCHGADGKGDTPADKECQSA